MSMAKKPRWTNWLLKRWPRPQGLVIGIGVIMEIVCFPIIAIQWSFFYRDRHESRKAKALIWYAIMGILAYWLIIGMPFVLEIKEVRLFQDQSFTNWICRAFGTIFWLFGHSYSGIIITDQKIEEVSRDSFRLVHALKRHVKELSRRKQPLPSRGIQKRVNH